MLRPDRGTISIDGVPVDLRSNRDAIRAGIGYLSEDRLSLGLIQPQSIADNIVLPVLDKILDRRTDFDAQEGRAGRPLGRAISRSRSAARSIAVSTLSGGNQQRVAIAKWLAVGLEADHPRFARPSASMSARAPESSRSCGKLADEGLAILLISDEVPEVYFNADRVLHMADGRIVGEYDPRQIALSELEAAVYA